MHLPEEEIGAEIVRKALTAPIKTILSNGGYPVREVLSTVSNKKRTWYGRSYVVTDKNVNYGFNALTGTYCDMLEVGIVDASKVVRQAITNASSLAGTLLTASGTITNLREE